MRVMTAKVGRHEVARVTYDENTRQHQFSGRDDMVDLLNRLKDSDESTFHPVKGGVDGPLDLRSWTHIQTLMARFAKATRYRYTLKERTDLVYPGASSDSVQ